MTRLRDWLERHQISIYLLATFLAALTAYLTPATTSLDAAINPALALMLFVTFLRRRRRNWGALLRESASWNFARDEFPGSKSS